MQLKLSGLLANKIRTQMIKQTILLGLKQWPLFKFLLENEVCGGETKKVK